MAGKIPQSYLDDLLAVTDLVSLIGEYVRFEKQSGHNRMACCPFHAEKTPSFSVNPTKQFYYCFGCGAGGNAISFLMAQSHIGFMDAVEKLAERANKPLPDVAQSGRENQLNTQPIYAALAKAQVYYQQQLSNRGAQDAARQYVNRRGLSPAICERYGVGYASGAWDGLIQSVGSSVSAEILQQAGLSIQHESGRVYDRFRDRLMFPIYDLRGRVLGFGGRLLEAGEPKYLNSPETPVFQKGRLLYGLYQALQQSGALPYLIIVEGYMDVLSLVDYGITQAVATLGTALTQAHIQLAFRHTDKVIFCFDGDAAGLKAASKAMHLSLGVVEDGKEIAFVHLPSAADPDSFIRENGLAAFEAQLTNAMPFSEKLLETVFEQSTVSSLDGRARLVTLAKPLLKEMPESVLREMMVNRIAEKIKWDVMQVKASIWGEAAMPKMGLQARRRRPDMGLRPKARDAGVTVLSHAQKAASLVLQHFELASSVSPEELFLLANSGDSQERFFCEIVRCIVQEKPASIGALLQYWQGSDALPGLFFLANKNWLLSAENLELEFKGIMNRLLSRFKDVQLDELSRKAAEGGLAGLSEAEKAQIKQMLQERIKEER